jgi:hypothetical protein
MAPSRIITASVRSWYLANSGRLSPAAVERLEELVRFSDTFVRLVTAARLQTRPLGIEHCEKSPIPSLSWRRRALAGNSMGSFSCVALLFEPIDYERVDHFMPSLH